MTVSQIVETTNKTKTQIGKKPVVVIPLREWRVIEDVLEDYEAKISMNYRASIEQARNQIKTKKIYSFDFTTGKTNRITMKKL